MHSIWSYILVMAIVTYSIRVLPLTLIRSEIKNRTIILCSLCDPGGHDLSGDHQ